MMTFVMAVLSGLVVVASASPRCSIRSWHYGPDANFLVVLAVATGDTVRVSPRARVLGQEVDPPGLSSVLGFRFAAIEAIGGTGEITNGDVFVAVPWEYDSECNPLVWKSRDWVEGGDTVVFAYSSPAERGRLRIDVPGWHSPYPHVDFLQFPSGAPVPGNRAEWLSSREYYELLKGLPAPEEKMTPAEERERIEVHFRTGNPRWSSTYPGVDILLRVREKAGGSS